jgi:hypothetical protein
LFYDIGFPFLFVNISPISIKENNAPVAVIEHPFYLEKAVQQIQLIFQERIMSPNSRTVYRHIYTTWRSKITGPGKTELLFLILIGNP